MYVQYTRVCSSGLPSFRAIVRNTVGAIVSRRTDLLPMSCPIIPPSSYAVVTAQYPLRVG